MSGIKNTHQYCKESISHGKSCRLIKEKAMDSDSRESVEAQKKVKSERARSEFLDGVSPRIENRVFQFNEQAVGMNRPRDNSAPLQTRTNTQSGINLE